jgi:hypothetical protein
VAYDPLTASRTAEVDQRVKNVRQSERKTGEKPLLMLKLRPKPPRKRRKVCRKCGAQKPLDEFPLRERSADGHGSWCLACHRQASAEWRRRQVSRGEDEALTASQRWELLGPSGDESHFSSEAEKRAAWEEHREELIECARDRRPGHRPKAWWSYEAARPEHLGPYPLEPPPGEPRWGEAHGRAIDCHEFEPILYLAAHGQLTDDEVKIIRERGVEAAERVGTDREQRGTTYAISSDRSAIRLARAVDAALGGEQDAGPDYGMGRGRHVDAELSRQLKSESRDDPRSDSIATDRRRSAAGDPVSTGGDDQTVNLPSGTTSSATG